jgi:DNA-binding MarR family transcriptional regulator
VTHSPPRVESQDVPAGYSQRLSLLINKLALELLGRAADGLAELGLTDRQYLALAVLATDEPGSQHELGKLMGLAPQLVVALTDSLEDRGLVTRRTNPDDRRRTLVELTRAGRRALAHADELMADVEDQLFGVLDADARDELKDILRRALAAAYSRDARPDR